MKLIFVGSEAYPVIKTGGLGDVLGALPEAVAALGHDVRLLLPGYRGAKEHLLAPKNVGTLKDLPGCGAAGLVRGALPGWDHAQVLLLDCPHLFDRDGGAYAGPDGQDWPDNAVRFAALGAAAAQLALRQPGEGWRPDVVHAHDWQAGLLPAYLNMSKKRHVPSVFTIHNLRYQGLFDVQQLGETGLPEAYMSLDGMEFYGQMSYLKAGLQFSDLITTVSPTYAAEIQTKAHGFGLEGVLQEKRARLSGILNGIDDRTWDPENDAHLFAPYGKHSLAEKTKNKMDFQEHHGLKVCEKTPLLALISRFTPQKGIDLVLELLPFLHASGVQLAVLGTGDKDIEQAFEKARASYDNLSVILAYDETLAHRLMAAADMFLMPSRFEPCGLTQMYAMRYGTPPIAHKTGGLADTVRDPEQSLAKATGFLFSTPDAEALRAGITRALAFYEQPEKWRILQSNGMKTPFGWERAAKDYERHYVSLCPNSDARKSRSPR